MNDFGECTGRRLSRHPFTFLLLLLPLTLLLGSVSACRTTGGSSSLFVGGTEGKREIRLADLRRQASRTLIAGQNGVRLKVHHRTGELDTARAALGHLREAVAFVGFRFGVEADWVIHTYLAPLGPGEKPPNLKAHGQGLTLVLFSRGPTGESLLDIEVNARILCSVVPHEMSHILHYKNGVFLADGWLGEGIPEYVAEQFREHYCGESLPVLRADEPPLVAFQRVEIKPWKHYELVPGTPWGRLRKWFENRRERKRERRNPHAARLEEIGRSWKYSAAGPLVGRLVDTARERGFEEPFRELLARIEDRQRIGWEESQEIALEMTGRPLPELAEVGEEEVQRARQEAWELRTDGHPLVRLRALSTLRFLGLPERVAVRSLLSCLELPEEIEPSSRGGRQLLQAVTGAIAAAGEPSVAQEAIERLGDGTLELHQAVAPELWGLLAEAGHRQEALAQLEATVEDRTVEAEEQQRAAALIDEVTGDR